MGPAGCDVWPFPWPTSTGGMVSWLCMMEVASAGRRSPMPGTRWALVLRPHGMWAVSLMPSWGRTKCWTRRRWIFGPCPGCHRKSGHRAGGPVQDVPSGEPALCPGESPGPCRLARGGPGAAPFAWPAALVGREVPSAAPAQARWHPNHTPLPPHILDHEWGPLVCSRGCSCSPSGGGLQCRCQWSHPGCCKPCPRHSEIPGCRRPRLLWKWGGDHAAPGQSSWRSLVSAGRVSGPGPGGGSGRPPHVHSHAASKLVVTRIGAVAPAPLHQSGQAGRSGRPMLSPGLGIVPGLLAPAGVGPHMRCCGPTPSEPSATVTLESRRSSLLHGGEGGPWDLPCCPRAALPAAAHSHRELSATRRAGLGCWTSPPGVGTSACTAAQKHTHRPAYTSSMQSQGRNTRAGGPGGHVFGEMSPPRCRGGTLQVWLGGPWWC